MSSAISPTTRAANDNEGPLTQKSLSELIKYYKEAHRVIVQLTAEVNRLPSNQGLQVGHHKFKASDINSYSRIFMSQLDDLKKIFNRKKKRRTNKGNNQAKALFYVSDQLVDFYKNSKLGPADPENPKSKLSKEIDLLTKHHMANSGILTSLITNYIEVNGLKVKPEEEGKAVRFRPDDRMLDAFSDCVYTLNGKNISKRKLREGTPEQKRDEIKEKISHGKQSACERLQERVYKNGECFYEEENGFLYSSMMAISAFYRVPDHLLTLEEKAALSEEDNIHAAEELQQKLSKITEHRKARKQTA